MSRDELVERAASAHRPTTLAGAIAPAPAWHDLDDDGRREAFERASALRRIEAALDPDGMSTTARAVLARLRR